ncbi:tetratricopeptide repeat protein [Nibrella viscosa]|uniref:Tetratricopeptide repeat protein n=1 Tax=Nibrella viscosa TaxID=1084524 RepID=A0ABP8KME5_9BACT
MEGLITHTWRKWVLAGAGCLAVLAIIPVQAQRKARPKEEQSGIGGGTLNQGIDESLFTEGMKYIMTDEPTKAIAQFEKLIQKNPANAAAQYAVASALLKSGKITEALSYAQKAYQLDNGNKYYALQLAEIFVKQKRYAEAENLYEAVLQKGPDNIEYGVELAAIYLFDDKPDKALETYDKVEKVLGLNEEIIRQKQRIYLKQNKVDKAIEEAEKLAAAEPGEPDYLIEGAELLIANDRLPQALTWLERALKISPDLPQAHVLLADVYRKQGNMEKYRQELKYVFSNPNLEANIKARILSSYMDMAGENPTAKNDALKMAQDLVQANPKDAGSQVMMADLLMQMGKKAEARDAYVKAARVDGSVFEVWGAILELDGALNQVDSLLVHANQALEVFPTQGQLWLAKGSGHLFKRQYQDAVDALEESRRLLVTNKELSRNINAQLGDAFNGLGDYARSDEAYEQVLKADPNNDYVLNNYSYFLSLRKEKLPQALQMSQKLVERNPNNATYLDTYAWVLYVMKEYSKARQYLEKALQADPANVSGTIIEHYGDVLYQLGERDKAVEQWKKAKLKGENSEQLDKKIATGKI